MNGLSNLDETYVEYSPAPTDDLVSFWRSKVNGQRLLRWQRHLHQRWGIQVHLVLMILMHHYVYCCRNTSSL